MNARLMLLLTALLPLCAFAQSGNIPDRFTILPDPDFKSLDEKVQSLRKDVLDLSKDLAHLQDELLTAGSTKVSVFVSLDPKETLNLDSVQLLIDNRPVANYLYSAAEQEALRRGGVQRLFLGNVAVGPHQLTASFIGRDAAGRERRATVSQAFDKSMAAKFFELKASEGSTDARMAVKEWE